MSKYEIPFLTAAVQAFGQRFAMTRQAAFNYSIHDYSPEQAARLLQDKYLDQQYYFGTERTLNYIHKTNVETV